MLVKIYFNNTTNTPIRYFYSGDIVDGEHVLLHIETIVKGKNKRITRTEAAKRIMLDNYKFIDKFLVVTK
jgi:hypothetical protein